MVKSSVATEWSRFRVSRFSNGKSHVISLNSGLVRYLSESEIWVPSIQIITIFDLSLVIFGCVCSTFYRHWLDILN